MNAYVPRIPRLYLNRLVFRGVMFNVLIHIALMLRGKDFAFGGVRAPIIGIVVAVLAYTEMTFRREHIFAENLGIAKAWLYVLPAAVAILLDVVIGATIAAALALP